MRRQNASKQTYDYETAHINADPSGSSRINAFAAFLFAPSCAALLAAPSAAFLSATSFAAFLSASAFAAFLSASSCSASFGCFLVGLDATLTSLSRLLPPE